MAANVPVYISYGGRALVVWECDKYTVGRAGLDLVGAQEGSRLSLFRSAVHIDGDRLPLQACSLH